MSAIEQVIKEEVSAAVEERPPVISGLVRLRRNVAAHAAFGGGAAVVMAPAAELRRRQRGGRRRRVQPEAELCCEGTSEALKVSGTSLGVLGCDCASTEPVGEASQDDLIPIALVENDLAVADPQEFAEEQQLSLQPQQPSSASRRQVRPWACLAWASRLAQLHVLLGPAAGGTRPGILCARRPVCSSYVSLRRSRRRNAHRRLLRL